MTKNAESQDIFMINLSNGNLSFLDLNFQLIFSISSITNTPYRYPINLTNHAKQVDEGDVLIISDGNKILVSVWIKQQIQ